jgi:hypothetical protein
VCRSAQPIPRRSSISPNRDARHSPRTNRSSV